MLAVLRSERKHSTVLLVHGTLHPIYANRLEVVVLLSLYLAVLDNQSDEEQFIDVFDAQVLSFWQLFQASFIKKQLLRPYAS